MSNTSHAADEETVRDFLSVADLLEEPQLARIYTHVDRHGETTVQELIEDLGLPQGTAYSYVNRLVEAGVVESVTDDQPHAYVAREIDLTVSAPDSDGEYTITPALVDAVGRQVTDDDVAAYVDRHGVAGLATALPYAVARERGEVTHRLMADDLDLSPIEAEVVLQALRPVVFAHFDVDEAGASLDEIEGRGVDES